MTMFKSSLSSNWADDEIEIPHPTPAKEDAPDVPENEKSSKSAGGYLRNLKIQQEQADAPAEPEKEKSSKSAGGYLRNLKLQQEQADAQQRELHERAERPSAPVPDVSPFIAHVGNLPYSVTEEDIMTLFKGLHLEKMRIPMDYHTKQPKGFAYVEFTDRESLVEALGRKGEFVGERPARIDVAVERKSKRDYDSRQARNYSMHSSDERTSNEHTRDYFHRRTSQNDAENPNAEKSASMERPKLKLLARSSTASSTDTQEESSRKASIFGNAKPRDEAQTRYTQKNQRKSSNDQTDENQKNKMNASGGRNSTGNAANKKSWKRTETDQPSSDRRKPKAKQQSRESRGGRRGGKQQHRQGTKADEDPIKQAVVQGEKPTAKVTNAFELLDSESDSESDEE